MKRGFYFSDRDEEEGDERKIEIESSEFKVSLNCKPIVRALFFFFFFFSFLPTAIIIAIRQLAAASNFFSWANVMARQLREKPLPTPSLLR